MDTGVWGSEPSSIGTWIFCSRPVISSSAAVSPSVRAPKYAPDPEKAAEPAVAGISVRVLDLDLPLRLVATFGGNNMAEGFAK
ncbi:unnamed protein product [Arctia plantaginis]|uniref:Uncharacterized protein n=1 Tax=Arctia plantaginis TaxID=874455 RepID=A0A8S1ATL4_ARCPL|nr:unnamed protein product [Arctia plantaginis]